MRIIYISIGHVADGVRKKLEDKTQFLRQAGLDVTLCWVDAQESTGQGNGEFLSVDHRGAQKIASWPGLWRISVAVDQRNIYRSIDSFLNGKSFDWVLMRYPVADYFLLGFVKKYPGKVVFEHNTIEEKELKIRQKDSFYYRYFFWGEKMFGKRVRSMAAGMIGVTPEITAWQTSIAGQSIPAITVSNGIQVNRVPVRRDNPFNGKELNLLLLAGSEAPWHGVEILLSSLKRYSGDYKIHCYVAGSLVPGARKEAEQMQNVTLLPNQAGVALDQLVDNCHIGIGSLGFGNAFLKQASTLKVREYWSRGLPFILAYADADLEENPDMLPYYLRVPGDESLDLEDVVAFASRVYSNPHVSQRLRELAFKNIDYQIKASAYSNFLNSLVK